MDALALLHADHHLIEWLIEEYEQLSPDAHRARGRVVNRFRSELAVHLGLCEQIFYPTVRKLLPDLDDLLLEQLAAVRAMSKVSVELGRLEQTDLRYQQQALVLFRSARRHLAVEADHLLPRVGSRLAPEVLDDLGQRLSSRRASLVAAHPIDDPSIPTRALALAAETRAFTTALMVGTVAILLRASPARRADAADKESALERS